ncbi:helix-turn-helix transcriptional regulator [Paenibacillus sp. 1001270B_150601_E10]|uniref:helix-turn-helix transcriptional regulator n=1 Tax=Paenibacillus sp. 1001270B_150601_E10 TaxID=2787079 RepID=UPI00189CD10F|nr:AraC family transcriptional regulator [Paenibacillus sp. 1001270B_150601_E10]
MTEHIKNERWVYFADWERSPATRVEDLLLLGYDHFSKATPLTSHKHEDAYEFVYVDQGAVDWEVGEEFHRTNAQHIIHTRPGEQHRASFDYIGPSTIWWMIIRDPAQHIEWFGLQEEERQTFVRWMQNGPRVQLVSKDIVIYFKRLKQLLQQPCTELLEFQLRHYVLELLLQILHHPQHIVQSPNMNTYTQQLKVRLQQNPADRYAIEQLAEEMGLSQSHFYRVFRETNGQSPTSYMERIRMDYACQMLTESKMTITDIAMELGFKTSQHFSTVFKKMIGMTPKAWRKQHTQLDK